MKTLTAAVALLALASCAPDYKGYEGLSVSGLPSDNHPSSYLPHDEHGGPGLQVASAVVRPAPRSVPIEYVDDEPLVRIATGGASFRCVLDTGSSSLVIPLWLIDEGVAKYGAFRDHDMTFLNEGQATLAGGGTIKTVEVRLREITLGPWTLRNVPVTVTQTGDCLLGMAVLKQFGRPVIDFASGQLILED
jgi:hypothetical protein